MPSKARRVERRMRPISAMISAEAGSALRGSDPGVGSAEGVMPAFVSSGSSGGGSGDGIELGLTPLVSLPNNAL